MGAQVGLVGLAVMGQNLALNIERNGFPIAVFNRTGARTKEFVEGPAAGKKFTAAYTLEELVAAIDRPRKIILMVQAGAAVDEQISRLKPLLEDGDILADAGNSLFQDTERRSKELDGTGLNYVGMGVSGGEEGALWGPSIMPGGSKESYAALAPILTAIAARSASGDCVTHIGPRGAGHYVKMVHNGIEYGDMQLIAETYSLMQHALGLSAPQMAEVFTEWNRRDLDSYLIEITANVLAFTDPDTGNPLVDLILDKAGQKGTGRWMCQDALELGTPIPTIDAAVWSRSISSFKDARVRASEILTGPEPAGGSRAIDGAQFTNDLEAALWAAKVSSYAQGLDLLRASSRERDYGLNLAEIARIWTGGCIIRAKLLAEIQSAYTSDPDLPNLMLSPEIAPRMNERTASLRAVIKVARDLGVPVPAMSAALDYFDSYRAKRLPANLIQGQRDYFGAHTYQRVDKDGVFHTEWPFERQTRTTSGSYNA
ncbi:MAG TPA: NADP-dependent phosphogluconate dehydrogenase [Chloroflexota bacterium]|nr:NADP-dependent phosphogluconate dehydrogenase [Chloroflexota bacterium]